MKIRYGSMIVVAVAPLLAQGEGEGTPPALVDCHGCDPCRGEEAGEAGDEPTGEQLEDLLSEAAEALGLGEIQWQDPSAGQSATGSFEFDCDGETRNVVLGVRVVDEDSDYYAIVSIDDHDLSDGEDWTLEIYSSSFVKTYGQEEGESTGSAFYLGAMTQVMAHELLHICRIDAGDFDVHSCAHLRIEVTACEVACGVAQDLSECLAELENCTPPPGLDQEELDAWTAERAVQKKCLEEMIEGLCASIEQMQQRWGSSEGLSAANGCAEADELGGPSCCGDEVAAPAGGWDEANPPISDCAVCQ